MPSEQFDFFEKPEDKKESVVPTPIEKVPPRYEGRPGKKRPEKKVANPDSIGERQQPPPDWSSAA